MRILSRFILVAFLCLYFAKSNGQKNNSDTVEVQHAKNNTIKFIQFNGEKRRSILNSKTILKNMVNANEDDDFILIKDNIDKKGFVHQTFQQYYKGILVAGGSYQVHGKGGNIEVLNGHFKKVKGLATFPTISENQAINSAISVVSASKYKWQDTSLENLYKKNRKDIKATFYPHADLAIVQDYRDTLIETFKLAWIIKVGTLLPNCDERELWVDADNGDIILNKSTMHYSNTPLTAQTMYSGTLTITGDSYSGGYRLYESRNGTTIHTLDNNNTSNFGAAIEFSNSNTSFTSTNWSQYNSSAYNYKGALDAHWALEKISDFWLTKFGRSSYDNNNGPITAYVYYNNTGVTAPYVGWLLAGWEPTLKAVLCGQGDNYIFKSQVSLDIIAHEFAHGVDNETSKLTLYSPGHQECDEIAEGVADIWSAVVEQWAAPGKQTWQLCEEAANGNQSTYCYRNFQDPKSGASFLRGPSTYGQTYWSHSATPQQNGLLAAHWFYLLSVGGSGTNEISNNFSVSGIGINDGAAIVYQAQTQHLLPGDDFAAFRNATILSARELFGAGSCQEVAVSNAWFAVGVGSAFFPSNVSISGPAVICSSETYTLVNAPSGVNLTWTVTPSSVVSVSQTGNSITLTKISDAPITLSVSNANCAVTIPNSTRNISVGNSVTGIYNVSSNYYTSYGNSLINSGGSVFTRSNQTILFNVELDQSQSLSNINWSVSGTYNLFYPNGYSSNLYMTTPANAYASNNVVLNITATGACGNINKSFNFQSISTGSGGYFMVASPNPANGSINISIEKSLDTATLTQDEAKSRMLEIRKKNITGTTKLTLYDIYSNSQVKEWTFPEVEGKKYKLNLSGVSKGIYILKMNRDNMNTSAKIIVN